MGEGVRLWVWMGGWVAVVGKGLRVGWGGLGVRWGGACDWGGIGESGGGGLVVSVVVGVVVGVGRGGGGLSEYVAQ